MTLFKGKTKRGTLIEVREVYGKRKMDLDGYPQSNPRYYSNWKRILRKIRFYKDSPGLALMLGLGGGDVVDIIAKYTPMQHTTVVEIDSTVIKVAKEYFDIGNDRRRTIIQADAEKYLSDNRRKYDLIIVDLYDGDAVPTFVATDKFLWNISKSLDPHGYAIINYASHSFGKSNFDVFESKLEKVYSKIDKIIDWGHTYYVVGL